MNLIELQQQVAAWNKKNFPDGTPDRVLIGAGEELGELFHAHLKQSQGIRGTDAEHRAAAKDAIGDICIYLMAYCAKRGFQFDSCIRGAWDEVKNRNWKRNRKDGKNVRMD